MLNRHERRSVTSEKTVMRRFTPEEEAILKGQLQVTPDYRAL
jgi:hypothetical protein